MQDIEPVQEQFSFPQPSFSRKDLDTVLQTPEYSPTKLIELFSQDYGDLFTSDGGGKEKYTIGQHTEMVLSQFDRYFGNITLPGNVDPSFFRTVLVLHDIGKPEAIRRGNKHLQHQFTVPIVDAALKSLNFNEDDRNLAKALLSEDPIGEALIGTDVQASADIIRTLAKTTHLHTADFFDLLTILYKADAGSYTKDAGGHPSVDYLFRIDNENNQLNFAPPQQWKLRILRNRVLS